MRVLDCGCGPGAMTVTLAETVAPGDVIGLDPEPGQFTIGREVAQERGIDNVAFVQGTIYALPFEDESFDAVYAHAVLYHLRDPVAALREMHRVLRPGGVAGVRDSDVGGDLYAPRNPLLDRAWELAAAVIRGGGGHPEFGRAQRAALREVGFVEVVASASYDVYASPDVVPRYAAFWRAFLGQQHARSLVSGGWTTPEELGAIEAALLVWGEHPDAFAARARCEAVGWKAG
jgi:ubiquinone/menaquinone biosynthesis C-methylase UbiE